MRKTKLDQYKESKGQDWLQRELTLDQLLEIMLGGQQNPTQKRFIYSSAYWKGFMGPAGSAKTSTLVAAGLARALFQPGSKGLVARMDYNDLMDTTMLRVQEMIDRLPPGIVLERTKAPPMKLTLRPIPIVDANGVVNEAPTSITFMGLRDSLGSYDFNWAIIDEADQVPENRVLEVATRLRTPGGNYSVMLAFNPPEKTHWLYTACTGKDWRERKVKDAWMELFTPLSKENSRNLPADYYERMSSLPPEMRQRLRDGEWGSVFDGMPVYPEFKYDLHTVSQVNFESNIPLYRFWDFGYNHPACIWAQLDAEGRLNVLRAEMGDQLEIRPWARYCKTITSRYYGGASEVLDFGDPAVKQKKDTGSTLSELYKEGISMRYRVSRIDDGVRVIRERLSQLIRGKPSIVLDRQNAPILISGFKGGYHNDEHGKPVKDGYYDHLMDAMRYGCINLLYCAADYESRAKIHDKLDIPDSVEYDRLHDRGDLNVFENTDV